MVHSFDLARLLPWFYRAHKSKKESSGHLFGIFLSLLLFHWYGVIPRQWFCFIYRYVITWVGEKM